MKLKVVSMSVIDKRGNLHKPGEIIESSDFPEESIKDWLEREVISQDITVKTPKTEIDKVTEKDESDETVKPKPHKR